MSKLVNWPIPPERAQALFGDICFSTEEFELRACVDKDGLHAYAFRKVDGVAQLPRGFVRGSGCLLLERRVAEL